jgi:hypothetical protein
MNPWERTEMSGINGGVTEAMRYEYLIGGLEAKWKLDQEQAQLNECGQQGWELVSVVPRPIADGKSGLFYYFRRPICDQTTANGERLDLAAKN